MSATNRLLSSPAPAPHRGPTPGSPRRSSHSEPAGAELEAPGSSAGLLALTVFVLAMLWATITVFVRQDHLNTRQVAEVNLSNLTRAFAEHTTKTLEGADQAVRFVRSEYLAHRQSLDIQGYLNTQAIIDEDYHLLTVIGPDGYVSHSSRPFTRVDLHEREHFKVHAEGSGDRLFVSKPVLGKVSGKWSIQITRRISEPDGSFGGVVVVSMPPGYFTRFYSDVDLGDHGVIALVGTDGVMRARATSFAQDQGQDVTGSSLFQHMARAKNGVVLSTSNVDGVERLWSFRTLDGVGLIVVTGVGTQDLYADQEERRVLALTIGALVSVVVLLFAVRLFGRARRQAQLVTELRASQVKAEAANQMKSKFLASVSHELRTPLNGILGYAELIRDTAQDPQAAEFGGIIHDSARHLHSLVNTILDLAKIESGHMVTSMTAVELRPLLDEVHRLHAVHAQSRGLDFRFEVASSCPDVITTDRTRLLQILANVVNNAIKFTERGEVSLRAEARDGHLLVHVQDTGIGIAPDRLATLFTRFQGVADELVHRNQGAGLGLPLAKELAELLRGTLSVRSELGSGTEVCLSLPIETSVQGASPHDRA